MAPGSFGVFGSLSDEKFDYTLSEDFRRGVRRYLANHDAVYEVVTASEVRGDIVSQPLFGDTRSVAEEWAKIGINSYKHLRTGEAIKQLENAIEKYDAIDYDVVDPKRVSEVLMYLALSYLNEGDNAARPLVLMKRMIRLDPSRLLRHGFYPDKIANFFASARQDALRELREKGPEEKRAEELLEMTDAELVVFGNVFAGGEAGYEATLRVYSKKLGEFVEPETLHIREAIDRTVRAASNRLMSRYTPCIVEPEATGGQNVDPIVKSSGDGPLSIHVDFAYGSFLIYPNEWIDKPFGNIGVGLGANLLLTQEFGLGLTVQVLDSQRDYSGRIVDGFSTVRTIISPDLGFGVGRFNFGLSVGLEGTHISRFVICKDLNEPAQKTNCPDPEQREAFDDLDFLLGVNARPRVRYRLIDAFELTAGAGYTYFFVPFSTQPLNNLISGEGGIQYRF